MTPVRASLATLLLAFATIAIAYCAYFDMARLEAVRFVPLWRRPLLLLPVALTAIVAAGLLFEDR